MEEDLTVKKKLLELQMKMLAKRALEEGKPERKDPEEVLRKVLIGRGPEVLNAAKQQYPELTAVIVKKLAELVERGYIKQLTGEELYGIFLELGIRVRLPTRIVYKKKGKSVSIAEKLREE